MTVTIPIVLKPLRPSLLSSSSYRLLTLDKLAVPLPGTLGHNIICIISLVHQLLKIYYIHNPESKEDAETLAYHRGIDNPLNGAGAGVRLHQKR